MPTKVRDLLLKNPKLMGTVRSSPVIGKKYWCFPEVENKFNSRTGEKSSSLTQDFPDPAEYWLGFIWGSTNKNQGKASIQMKSPDRYISSASNTSRYKKIEQSIKKPLKYLTNKHTVSPESLSKGKEAPKVSSHDRRVLSLSEHIISDPEELDRESPMLISAGSGSESATKFCSAVPPQQSPLISEKKPKRHDLIISKKKLEENNKLKKSKAAIGKDKYDEIRNVLKIKESGKTQGMFTNSKQKNIGNKKDSCSEKNRMERKSSKKTKESLKIVTSVSKTSREPSQKNSAKPSIKGNVMINLYKRNSMFEINHRTCRSFIFIIQFKEKCWINNQSGRQIKETINV